MKTLSCFLLSAAAGLACSCSSGATCWVAPSASSQFAEFVGKPIKIRRPWFSETVDVDFAVSEAFGKLRGKTTITVQTQAQSTACGYPFQLGVEYFVRANFVEGTLGTNSCSGTRPAVVAAALIRQARAVRDGRAPAALFGYIGAEPYPGMSPLSRLEGKPVAMVEVTAVGRAGQFRTLTAADGSFEFTKLPESRYQLRVQLPKDLFIWWAARNLDKTYAVSPNKTCEADFALYRQGDPFAANQR